MNDDGSTDDLRRSEALQILGADGTPDRRNFLRATAASALAAVGLTAPAAALDPEGRPALRHAANRYRDAATARRTVEREADDLLDLLAERGHLDEASVDSLDGFRVSGRRVGDTATARISSVVERDGVRVTLAVEPEADRRYAVVRDGGEPTVLDPAVEDGEVEPSACMVGPSCVEDDSTSGCGDYDVHCCDTYCYIDNYQGSCGDFCQSCTEICN